MQGHLTLPGGLSRRHLIAGALGAAAAPVATRALARAVPSPATEEDVLLMRIAVEEAAKGDYPFGAVIARDGEVLIRGRNLGEEEQDPTAHGEMVAIRRFLAKYGPEKLKGTTLYTSGEPCAMCMGAIVWCGIARLVFAASVDQLATKIGQIMVPATEIAAQTPFANIAITGGVLAEEAMKLFD